MKRKEKEQLKNMSEAELSARLRDLEKHLFQIKFKRASSPLENPIEIRLIRRKMAVIKTCLRTAELALAANACAGAVTKHGVPQTAKTPEVKK